MNTWNDRGIAPDQVKTILSAIVLTIFIISLSVVLVLNCRVLYYHDIKALGIEQLCGRSAEEIKQNYDALISYNSLFYRGALEFPTLSMSDEAAIHFADVKRIFDMVQIICIMSGIGTIAVVILNRKWRMWDYFRMAGILTLAVPTVLSTFMAMSWSKFFVVFHQILFRNDFWLFDPATDPIILMLPDRYFMHCALAILGCIVVGSLLCFFINRRVTRKNIHKKQYALPKDKE